MRVYELHGTRGIDSVTPATRPDPQAALPGQIILEMRAWSLNYRDLLIVNDDYGGLKPAGTIALSDGAGEVVAIGSGVRRFQVGDRVTPTFFSTWSAGLMTAADLPLSRGGGVDGVLAEFVACEERQAVRIPEHLSFAEAACLPCAGVTAWNALFGPRPVLSGQTVLTLGTGGVSAFAIAFAAAAGARVIATSSSDEKLGFARALGAADTINYRTHPEWHDEVLRLTGRRGVDHVVEIGGGGTIERSVASTAIGGQIHAIGVLSAGALSPRTLIPWKTLRGIMVGSAADHEAMNAMIAHHRLHPLVGKVFGFDQALDAYRLLATGNHVGKVVIELGAS